MRYLFCILLLALSGCGQASSGTEDQTPGATTTLGGVPLVSLQDSLTEDAFLEKIEADPAAVAAWEKLRSAGYDQFRQAGITGDEDGREVLWAEVSDAGGMLKTFVHHCTEGECVSAVLIVDQGGAHWQSPDGGAVAALAVGVPPLLKTASGPDLAHNTTSVVKLPLDLEQDLAGHDLLGRRFVVANAFGEIWGDGAMSMAPLLEAAEKTGWFDEVVEIPYVRERVVGELLSGLDGMDVLIWISQGLRMQAPASDKWVTLGLTVNRGGFGDASISAAEIVSSLQANSVTGPGVVFLAACDALGDGKGGEGLVGALSLALDKTEACVIGFQGCGDPLLMLEATTLFWEDVLDGMTYEEAVAAINGYLEQKGEKPRLAMKGVPTTGGSLVPGGDGFWSRYISAKNPEKSFFQANVNMVNSCTDGTDSYKDYEFFIQPWTDELEWDGPRFQGVRVNPDHNVSLEIQGWLTAVEVGAPFLFIATGNMGPDYSGITVLGKGVIQEIVVDKDKPDSFELLFDGTALVSDYTKENGDRCSVQPTLLLSTTGEKGTIRIPAALDRIQ